MMSTIKPRRDRDDLIHDLAIVLAGATHRSARLGPSPALAARRIKDALGWADGELHDGIEDRLREALGFRP
jgi:hypothetical protein